MARRDPRQSARRDPRKTARREPRQSARPGRGLWGAVFSLSVLAGITFVVGALAGLVWKEPGLLLAHLTGETSQVAWAQQASTAPALQTASKQAPAARPNPQASSPKPAGAKRTASLPAAVSPSRAVPAVAAAPPAASIAIQVGAFAERGSAESLRGELQKDGYPAYVAAGAAPGSPRWRVRVGPYGSREAADRVASQLKSNRSLPTWVLDEDAQ